jgi:uncharacterized membrane protein YhaH (DUF805 family)
MKGKSNLASGRRRKTSTFAWLAAIAILTIFLLYREMTALLYILATLGVTAILIVVALADLSQGEKARTDLPRADDSAAIGSGLSSSRRTTQVS